MQTQNLQSALLPIMLAAGVLVMLVGCERAGQTGDPADGQTRVDQAAGDERPLAQVAEFDGFTLRANLSRTEFLPDAMARQYGIESEPDLVLLNVVVLEKRQGAQPVPVSAAVSARYENRIGQVEVIDMRAAEADGYVSYIGTLDASAQRVFELLIEAQPEGIGEPLHMDFEVQLDTLGTE